MKHILPILFLSFIMDNTLKAQTFKTPNDTLSYSLGVLVGNSIKQQGFTNLNPDLIMSGLKSVLAGEPTLLTVDQCGAIVREVSTAAKAKQFEANKKTGEDFLATNKKREGVITLDNGLQYEIIKAGTGPKPTMTDKVLVHYHGTFIDGSIFDSSVDRGTPMSFGLNQVIRGWTEILQIMPEGSKWRVYIPYNLAYGEQGSPPKIPPYSPLIFDMELIEIQ